MFDGKDLAVWIICTEVYFQVQGTHPNMKVSLAQLYMVRSISSSNFLTNTPFWLGEGDLFKWLAAIQQEGSVDEYITEFEWLTAPVPQLTDDQYLWIFCAWAEGWNQRPHA